MIRTDMHFLFNVRYYQWRREYESGCALADVTDLRRSDLLGLYLMGGEL
jgi:hypothetical protein